LLYAKVDIHKQDGTDLSLHIVFKVFGYSLYDNLKPRKKRRKEKNFRKKVPASVKQESHKSSEDPEIKAYLQIDDKIDDKIDNIESTHTDDKPPLEDIGTPGRTTNIFHKIFALIEKIKNFISNIMIKIQNFKSNFKQMINKIKVLLNKKNKLIEILESDKNKPTFRKIKRIAIRILNHVKPKKVKGELYYGFDNPANTGYVLGIVSTIYPVYANRLKLYPDFEKSVFKGEIYIKGRIRTGVFLWYALHLYLDKNVRHIVKSITKI